jgi:putative heme iron utilization protein
MHERRELIMADAVAETSFAERARTLVHREHVGALATLSQRLPGFPFASVAPYGLDAHGNPTFLISSLAMHTQNLLADERASLLVNEPVPADQALAVARVTLVGRAQPVVDEDVAAVRDDYLSRHAAARSWAEMRDFRFYRLDVADAYYVAGFGAMGWVSGRDYHDAEVDPLADHAAGIIAHMNLDHGDAVLLYARALAGIEAESAEMVGVDRLGFQVRAQTAAGARTVRLGFPTEVRSTDDARQALIALLKTARQTSPSP